MNGKAFWKSKTLWFNVISGILVSLPDLGLDPKIVAEVTVVVNLILRFVTKQPLAATTPE